MEKKSSLDILKQIYKERQAHKLKMKKDAIVYHYDDDGMVRDPYTIKQIAIDCISGDISRLKDIAPECTINGVSPKEYEIFQKDNGLAEKFKDIENRLLDKMTEKDLIKLIGSIYNDDANPNDTLKEAAIRYRNRSLTPKMWELYDKYRNIEDKIPSVWETYEKAGIELAIDIRDEWNIEDPELIRVISLMDIRVRGLDLVNHINPMLSFCGLYPEKMKQFNIPPEDQFENWDENEK